MLQDGSLGLVPEQARFSDIVRILYGCDVLIVLRHHLDTSGSSLARHMFMTKESWTVMQSMSVTTKCLSIWNEDFPYKMAPQNVGAGCTFNQSMVINVIPQIE